MTSAGASPDEVLIEPDDLGARRSARRQVSNVILAYEPRWAIGASAAASPDYAAERHRNLRSGHRGKIWFARRGADSHHLRRLGDDPAMARRSWDCRYRRSVRRPRRLVGTKVWPEIAAIVARSRRSEEILE